MPVTLETVNRLSRIKGELEKLKKEKELLESEIIKSAEMDLKNTKDKTIHYEGDGVRATATKTSSVKVIYPSFLKKVFGKAYTDAVKVEPNYKLSESAKRLLSGIYLGDFVRNTIPELLGELALEQDIKMALEKKVKGAKFETDKKHLMNIAGMGESEAEVYAALAMEAGVWQNFDKLCIVNGWTDSEAVERTMKLIDGAIIVDESLKITIDKIG